MDTAAHTRRTATLTSVLFQRPVNEKFRLSSPKEISMRHDALLLMIWMREDNTMFPVRR